MTENKEPVGHRDRMLRQKRQVQSRINKAKRSKGLIVYLFGEGKGKSSSAFGTLCRTLGHGGKAGVVQFIKGKWRTGEECFFKSLPDVEYHCMASGFTWDTQNWHTDRCAAEAAWVQAAQMLRRPELDLIVLDEIAYMFAYEYLDPDQVLAGLHARPPDQHVFLTGRPRIPRLVEVADTVSEVVEVKHAFHQGVKAQKGMEW